MSEPLLQAVNLFDLGRYQEALVPLRAVLAERPEDPAAMRLVALCELQLDRLDAALSAANRLVSAHPDSGEGHRLASVVLQRLGQRSEAYRAAAHAVRTDPLDPDTHVQLALTAHRVRGHARESRAAAARAVELDPHDADAHFATGLTARRSGQRKAAYRAALAINPNHSGALNNLQVARGRVLSLTSLARGYLAVLEHDPTYETARQNLVGLTYRFLRRYYWFGLTLVVLGLLVGGRTWPIGVAVGVVAAAVMAWYAVGTLRQVPPGARSFLMRAWRSRAHLMATTLHTALVVACGLGMLLVPGGVAVGAVAVVPLIWANVALFVWGAASRPRAR